MATHSAHAAPTIADDQRELLRQAKDRLKEALGTTSILDPFVEMRIQAAVMTIDAVIKW